MTRKWLGLSPSSGFADLLDEWCARVEIQDGRLEMGNGWWDTPGGIAQTLPVRSSARFGAAALASAWRGPLAKESSWWWCSFRPPPDEAARARETLYQVSTLPSRTVVRKQLQPRMNTQAKISASFLAELLVSPPRKIVVFIMYKNISWIKVSKKYQIWFWKQTHWLRCRLHTPTSVTVLTGTSLK